jgi:hypothetical protein
MAVARRPYKVRPVAPKQERGFRFAQPSGRLDQGVEYGLQIEGRTANGLEHVSRRSLPLQRFAKLVEQPRIFDGDDGLIGEGRHQLDLLIGKWIGLVAGQSEDANNRSAPHQRHAKHSPVSTNNTKARRAIFGIGGYIRNMDYSPLD